MYEVILFISNRKQKEMCSCLNVLCNFIMYTKAEVFIKICFKQTELDERTSCSIICNERYKVRKTHILSLQNWKYALKIVLMSTEEPLVITSMRTGKGTLTFIHCRKKELQTVSPLSRYLQLVKFTSMYCRT